MMRKIVMIFLVSMSIVLVACGNKKAQNSLEQAKSEAVKLSEEQLEDLEESTTNPEKQVVDTEEVNIDIQNTGNENSKKMTESDKKEQVMTVEVNGQKFEAELYDNDTADAFKEMLPITFSMNEHNGNEKYIYMDQSLPSASEKIGSIQNGDIMLFGSDCLVVFYESFQTSYTYTRIGYIENSDGLSSALGNGSAEISFYMK